MLPRSEREGTFWVVARRVTNAQAIKLEILLELNIKLNLTLVFDVGILSSCM